MRPALPLGTAHEAVQPWPLEPRALTPTGGASNRHTGHGLTAARSRAAAEAVEGVAAELAPARAAGRGNRRACGARVMTRRASREARHDFCCTGRIKMSLTSTCGGADSAYTTAAATSSAWRAARALCFLHRQSRISLRISCTGRLERAAGMHHGSARIWSCPVAWRCIQPRAGLHMPRVGSRLDSLSAVTATAAAHSHEPCRRASAGCTPAAHGRKALHRQAGARPGARVTCRQRNSRYFAAAVCASPNAATAANSVSTMPGEMAVTRRSAP